MDRTATLHHHDIGTRECNLLQNYLIDAATGGIAGNVDRQLGRTTARVELGQTKMNLLLALAQAGHERGDGRITPGENERPFRFYATVRERRLLLQIEETFVLPLLAGYGRHVGQGSDLGRKSRLESPRIDNRDAGNSHRYHACAKGRDLCAAGGPEANRFLKPFISQPGEDKTDRNDQTPLQDRQCAELER